MKHETVLVLDFGGQYNELIARRVRDLGVYCEVHPYKKALEKIKELCPIGIIFTGGPNSVYEEGAPKVDPAVFQQGLPILGLCYGLQMMSQVLGGEVKSAPTREFGKTPVHYDTESLLFKGMPQEAICWMSHVDYVSRLPEGFTAICHTAATANAGIQCKEKNLYGVQFHPEVEHTQFGNDILKNFLYEICHAKGDWSMKDYARSTVEALREKIGDGKVLLALSGSEMVKAAQAIGLPVANEVFADRGYRPDGSLVPRGTPGAMIEDEDEAIARVIRMVTEGKVTANDGTDIAIQADSVCVHGDGPKALAFVEKIGAALQAAGVELKAF